MRDGSDRCVSSAMSWPQRAHAPNPSPRPPLQPPPQGNVQQPWMQNQYGNQPPPQQYWQQQPPKVAPNQPNQNYNQNYAPQQQMYGGDQSGYSQQYPAPNSNAHFQPQNYDAQYSNRAFHPNVQQQNAPVPDAAALSGGREPSESDPWNWGWEDAGANENRNAPVANNAFNQFSSPNSNVHQAPNVDVLSESFANAGEGWSFSANEPKAAENQQKSFSPYRLGSPQNDVNQSNFQNFGLEPNSNVHPHVGACGENPISPPESVVRNVNFEDGQGHAIFSTFNVGQPNQPNPPVEFPRSASRKSDSVPRHWPAESQPSQEANNSAISDLDGPKIFENIPNAALGNNANFNVNQPVVRQTNSEEKTNQELVNSVKSLSLNPKAEYSAMENVNQNVENAANILPPPIGNVLSPPNNAVKSPMIPSSSPNLLPPAGSSPGMNPFKRVGQLSHKNIPLSSPSQVMQTMAAKPQDAPIQQEHSNVRQSSPQIQNQDATLNHQAGPIAYANLETTPDNSERPDNPSLVVYHQRPYPSPISQPITENSEIAPNNDRNEYLQTGHLSEPSFNNAHFPDDRISRNNSNGNFPPPGLQRMVLGQPEAEFGQNSSFINDEPPPGLSRMVPGHTTAPLNMYNQSNDDYLDRQIDGQTTESDSLTNSACLPRASVYRQVDGQPTDDEANYNQVSRNQVDRRPVGFDRMIPGGEANSNFNIPFQTQNFTTASEERVVTGYEQMNSTEPREQNMDGSDYSEVDTNQIRNVNRSAELASDRNAESSTVQIQNVILESTDLQRDRNMEGENLQDISAMSIRDQNMDGADTQEELVSRTIDLIDSDPDLSRSTNSKQASQPVINNKDRKYGDDTTGDESERDRLYKINSLKKDKEGSRHRSSRDREGRYNDRRDDRRLDKERRGEFSRNERDRMNEDKRYKRNKERYDTEDTDYYSDRERRRYREGSYSSKPPRPDDRPLRKDDDSRRSYDRSTRDDRDRRRRDDRDKDRRYDNYDSERDGSGRRRERDGERDYGDRDDRSKRYSERDRQYSSLRKDKEGREDRKRGDMRDPRYRPPRPSSRDPEPADDEYDLVDRDQRRDRDRDDDRDRRSHRYRRDREKGYNEQYYERYGYSMDPYSQQLYQQQQTYQYYEKLRMTNPQAYLEIYNKYMSGAAHNMSQSDVSRAMSGYGEGYTSLPAYDPRTGNRLGDERGSVHSGRSSANGEAIKDRSVLDGSMGYYYPYTRLDNSMSYMKYDTPTRTRGDHGSIRTDYSGSRDFNTDASLNRYMNDSAIKSDRNTPVKFGTAHIKGVLSSPNFVIIRPSYPSDGQPAIIEILNINKLLSHDPICAALTSYPGPLVKGTTHKKTVIEFCESKIRSTIEKYTIQEKNPYGYQQFGNSSYSEKTSSFSNLSELGNVVLMWELLILLLRQNGMVVGTDIAELLIKNTQQYTWKGAANNAIRGHSRRDSASSATSRSADLPLEESPMQDPTGNQEVEHDSSNDFSADHSQSVSSNYKKERKSSKDNSIGTKPKRKTSANLFGESAQIQTGEKYITDKFREYLLFGSGKDALEWAMSHGLWGHALFLASKLDRRTYANVMARFANGLSPNDPLQTLYQLMSGRQPASVTCVLDDKWGDWRPHLAMILSNSSQRPELDKKSITTLGDTLNARGDLYAAQFCYLMARVEFGKRPTKMQNTNTPAPRLVLLGSSPTNENFALFASNDAIMMTEIYEYACNLADDNFTLIDFQYYKYLFATRLMDYGLYDRALFYMERIAQIISKSPANYEVSFLEKVLHIAERLKHYDPEDDVGEIIDNDDQAGQGPGNQSTQNNQTEQTWISSLRQTLNELNANKVHYAAANLTLNTTDYYNQPTPDAQYSFDQSQNWNQQYPNSDPIQLQKQYNQSQADYQNQHYIQDQQYVHQPNLDKTPDSERIEHPQMYDPSMIQSNNSLYYGQDGSIPSQQDSYGVTPEGPKTDDSDYRGLQSTDSGYWNQDFHNQQSRIYDYNEPEPVEGKTLPDTTDSSRDMMEQPRPQISMPNSSIGSRNAYGDDQESLLSKPQQSNHSPAPQKPSEKAKKDESAKSQASSGWFGGIFNKLSLKPKNQMILPDDKNPSIVWDPEKKKWMNLDADEDEQENQLQPPPKLPINSIPSHNPMAMQSPDIGNNPSPMPPSNQSNIFKLQKGRHIKKSYVDVFNPSGAPTRPLPPASEVLGAPLPAAPPSYFVPQSDGNQAQMAPSFYNPSDYATG